MRQQRHPRGGHRDRRHSRPSGHPSTTHSLPMIPAPHYRTMQLARNQPPRRHRTGKDDRRIIRPQMMTVIHGRGRRRPLSLASPGSGAPDRGRSGGTSGTRRGVRSRPRAGRRASSGKRRVVDVLVGIGHQKEVPLVALIAIHQRKRTSDGMPPSARPGQARSLRSTAAIEPKSSVRPTK